MPVVRDDGQESAAIDALRAHGAHSINDSGRFTTEEIERWRGQEVPDLLRC